MGQHYVPQEYLRAFQTTANVGEIWVYDKKTREERVLPIRAVAQSPGFYDDDVEVELSRIEARANRALRRVRKAGTFDLAERETLAQYVAIMLYRTPRKRRKSREMVPDALAKVTEDARTEIDRMAEARPPGDPHVKELHWELQRVVAKFTDTLPHEVNDQIRAPWPSSRVLNVVKQKAWRILISDSSEAFVTSDCPAVFFEGLGLGNSDSELTMALAPGVALVADHKAQPFSTAVFRVKPKIVREVNRRVVAHAERFVFASLRQWWISRVAHKEYPYLSRIQWDG